MNLLIDRLPSSVWIKDAEYEIRSDFRISILFELMFQDPEVTEAQRTSKAMELYFPKIPGDIEEAVEAILWFYRGGKDEVNVRTGSRRKSENRIYSFDYDDTYMYAAFLEQYGMDLNEVGELHWWKFRAMFHALKEDTEIRRIMSYRSMLIPADMDREKKEFYKSMKELYRIPSEQNEREKLSAIEAALLGSGDLSGLL